MQIAPILLTAWIALAQATGQTPAQAPAQPPAQPPAGQPPAKPPAAQTPRRQQTPVPVTRTTLSIQVTDLEGKGLGDVWVKGTGPVDRESPTDADGMATLRNMLPGTYRLRFEHERFVTFEREVVIQANKPMSINVALNAAPPPPEAPAREAAPATPALPPAGPPTSVNLIDLIEKNFVGNNPSLTSSVGCAPSATSSLLQIRDPLAQHAHADADEMIYVLGGEGTHKINGKDVALQAGVFAVIPRGAAHSMTRRGSRPLIFLSVLSGQPCGPK
jgi:mannose-6-phosphate isomerase-like protein (cupin superfamily)